MRYIALLPALALLLVACVDDRNPLEPQSEEASYDLSLESTSVSSFTSFTHTANRLVMTMWPAYLGSGYTAQYTDEYGDGLGVQFPVDALHPIGDPVTNSHMFSGGLVIGVEQNGGPPVILSNFDPSFRGICGAPDCTDFLDATVKAKDVKEKVKWTYSDAMSPTPVGLTVTQKSNEGKVPGDYVLIRYQIANTGASTVTFYAGFFADWDVRADPTSNTGFTEFNGQLASIAGTDGPYMGTVLLGDYPVTGTHFWPNASDDPITLDGQMNVLQGLFPDGSPGGMEAGTEYHDWRYAHSLGPIALPAAQSAEFWVAVVAGGTTTELRANAAAAAASVGVALPEPEPFSLASISPSVASPSTSVTITGTNLDQARWVEEVHLSRDDLPTTCAQPSDVTVPAWEVGDQLRFSAPTLLEPGEYDVYVSVGSTRSNSLAWELDGPPVVPMTILAISSGAVAGRGIDIEILGEGLGQTWDKEVHLVNVDTGEDIVVPHQAVGGALYLSSFFLEVGDYWVYVTAGCTRSNTVHMYVGGSFSNIELVSGENWWSPIGADLRGELFDGAITMAPDGFAFFTSSAEERTIDIELSFANVVEFDGENQYRPLPGQDNVSLAYRYLRSAPNEPPLPSDLTSTSNPWDWSSYIVNTSGDGAYVYQDRQSIAVAAWDVGVSPPRRLAVGFLENNVPGGLVNGAYGPAHYGVTGNIGTASPREWLFIFDVDYDEFSEEPDLARDMVSAPWSLPILAIVFASRAEPDRFPQQGDVVSLSHIYVEGEGCGGGGPPCFGP